MNENRSNYGHLLLNAATVLWIIWGLVHIMAGIMFISGSTGDLALAIGAVANTVGPTTLKRAYPDALGGILGQHGWNLFWVGVVTTVGAFFVWKGNRTAIIGTTLTGGLADLGYFLFIDLPGYATFIIGGLATYICAAAIILSLVALSKAKDEGVESV